MKKRLFVPRRNLRLALLLLALLAAPLFSSAALPTATPLGDNETIKLKRIPTAEAAIKVDGHLDEAAWSTLRAYDELVVIEPDTLAAVPHPTFARMFYNEKGLYFGIIAVQPKETLIKRLSGRDKRDVNRDGVSVTIDTSGEGRYGYWFGINLGDSQMDGTVLPERQFSSDWDGAWRGATQETEDGYTAELFIPWGTVAMPQSGDVRKLGFYMSRKVAYLDERWGWPGLPGTKPKFLSVLQQLELKGVAPKQQFSIYPFTAVAKERVEGEMHYRVGADFFWRPSSNFQLTATVNPDFGNVESDDVVINLSATETFFPEKRLFFVEGQEIFKATSRADTRGGGVGNRGAPTTLVNTRRIGGKAVQPTLPAGTVIPEREEIQPADLIAAVKATGQLGKLRYGVLAATEDETKFDVTINGQEANLHSKGSDYGIFRLFYEDSPGGSYRGLGVLATTVQHDNGDASALGFDGHYLTPDGKLKLDGQVMTSDKSGIDTGYGGFMDVEYTVRQGVTQRFGFEYWDENIDVNDLGYLQRNDNLRIRSAHTRTSSKLGWARDNQFDLRGFVQRNKEGLFTGGGVFLANKTTLNNLSSVRIRGSWIAKSFDDLNSYGNGAYRISQRRDLSVGWNSPSTGQYSYWFGGGFREEALGGDSFFAFTGISWRPNDKFSTFIDIGYDDRNGWLLHQEGVNFTTYLAEQWFSKFSAEYFISAKQQVRLSLQWVGIKAHEDDFFQVPATPGKLIATAKPPGATDDFSISQVSFQLRYRWELAPLSDLFVVYTRQSDVSTRLGSDPTFSDIFEQSMNRPLRDIFVIKLRYRFGT